ncbi:ribonuclease R family protein [Sulfuricurvum sp.]|uniref:RNB domain-containing ribonuclease n=1 Tax=Sulfuricurvum sp. TaxID=2025608 RepID=UPI0019906D9B|nr:ribonuclease R family protein [Sulfuricurvum sp.]MBD3799349.1 VacB/RNase II family 3'-5' exoribonuclease [Campylobacterota bacterium]MBD3806761.1 VacB/RNase II family 3'-5' exoribonuclease [Sulfuricurvum sp.]
MKSLLIRLTHGLYDQDIAESERENVQQWLALKLITHEEGKYQFASQYRAGTISLVSESGAYLQTLGESIRDHFIETNNLMGAKNGDLVIAQRLLGRRGGPHAKVVVIAGRSETYSVAVVSMKNGHLGLYDIRTDHPAGFALSDLSENTEGSLYQINNQSQTIAAYLGNLSDPKVDEKIVLALYNKHDVFEDDVLAMAREFPKEVDASLYPHRRDLRHLPFCTIDPVTAKDYDDAICFIPETSTLYVAIADVSEYVHPFGAIDAEAIYRSFSIYLPHRSIPMLPSELSETLCSLQENVDRLAYTFEIHIDPTTYEMNSFELYESIIHSHRRFTYEEIDAYLQGHLSAQNDKEAKALEYINDLNVLTRKLREKRMKKGYNFRSSELEMRIDEEQNIISTEFAIETPSHALIEDCMLLANKAAASMYERGVFRIHESPSPLKLQSLYTELASIGIFVESQGSIKETIMAIQAEAERRNLVSEVDTLIIRAQMQARYAPYNMGHFGLGFERYTHFTSPIRRYSDLIVHRLLKAIQAGDSEEGSYVLRNIESLCTSISEKEREASDIEIRFHERKFARWATTVIGQEFKARIMRAEEPYIAEIHDVITGAKVAVNSQFGLMLFDDIIVKIESSNLATAKITASFVRHIEKESDESAGS